MSKKYELTSETIETDEGITLYRIKALKDFGNVNKGDLGGFIELEDNLSQEGNCWVCEDAWIYGKAQISNNVRISGNAKVFGDAHVCGNAIVSGDAQVYGNTVVNENAIVFGDSQVCGNAKVFGDAQVFGDAHVCGNAQVFGDAQVYGNTVVNGIAWVYENAKVSGSSIINDQAHIEGNAQVMESSKIRGFCSVIKDNAIIRDKSIIDNSCIGDNAVIKKSKLEWSSVYYDSVIKDVALLFNANIKWDGYITKDEDCVTISGLRVPNYNDSSLRHPHYTDDITFYRKKYNQVGVVIHHGTCYNTLKEFDKVIKENNEKGNYTYDQAFPFIIEAMKRHFYPYNYCRK